MNNWHGCHGFDISLHRMVAGMRMLEARRGRMLTWMEPADTPAVPQVIPRLSLKKARDIIKYFSEAFRWMESRAT